MKAIWSFVRLAIVAIVFLIVSPGSARAMSFLRVIMSPWAAGMGQCAINLVDEESAIYNPGALGLFHLSKRAGFFFPAKSDYLPELADDISPRQFGICVGDAFDIDPGNSDNNRTFGAGPAYSRLKMVMPAQLMIDELGRVIGTDRYFEKSDNFSLAIGFDYWIRLGLGVDYKACEEGDIITTNRTNTYSAKGPAYYFGLLAEFPLSRLLLKNQGGNGQALSFDLIPSVAYVNANNGDNLKIDGEASNSPLPHISGFGLSILGTAQ
jgi:hypothetical protein